MVETLGTLLNQAYEEYKEHIVNQPLPPLPESVTDKIGQQVGPGDRIVYGSGRGDLSEGIVLNFQHSKGHIQSNWNYDTNTWYEGPSVKMKLESPNGQKTTIEVTRRHFAKVPHKIEGETNGN